MESTAMEQAWPLFMPNKPAEKDVCPYCEDEQEVCACGYPDIDRHDD